MTIRQDRGRNVAAAFDVQVGHQDCDEDGRGYVTFSARSSPAAAADRFLADAACSPASDAASNEVAVECASSDVTIVIYFDASTAGRADGNLEMESV